MICDDQVVWRKFCMSGRLHQDTFSSSYIRPRKGAAVIETIYDPLS